MLKFRKLLFLLAGRMGEKITITITISIDVPPNASVSISTSSKSGKERTQSKGEKQKHSKMPDIRSVDDLLKFTEGNKEYAKAIIKKYNLHGISWGDQLLVVTPEYLEKLMNKKSKMKDLEEAIERGEAIVVKPENLVKLL